MRYRAAIASCMFILGFPFELTPAVAFFNSSRSQMTSEVEDLVSYSDSPFIYSWSWLLHWPQSRPKDFCMFLLRVNFLCTNCLISYLKTSFSASAMAGSVPSLISGLTGISLAKKSMGSSKRLNRGYMSLPSLYSATI